MKRITSILLVFILSITAIALLTSCNKDKIEGKQVTSKESELCDGTYLVGVDLTAGEYLLNSTVEDNSLESMFEIHRRDSNDNYSLIKSKEFYNQHYVSLIISDKITVENCKITSTKLLENKKQFKTTATDGQYKVGFDFSVGHYIITPPPATYYVRAGYFEIMKSPNGYFSEADKFCKSGYISKDTTVYLPENYYIYISDCTITQRN